MKKFVPRQNLSAIEGKDRRNFARLEEVHGVKIVVLPTKDGDRLQGIHIENSSEGPPRCIDAADEIEKVSAFYFNRLSVCNGKLTHSDS